MSHIVTLSGPAVKKWFPFEVSAQGLSRSQRVDVFAVMRNYGENGYVGSNFAGFEIDVEREWVLLYGIYYFKTEEAAMFAALIVD